MALLQEEAIKESKPSQGGMLRRFIAREPVRHSRLHPGRQCSTSSVVIALCNMFGVQVKRSESVLCQDFLFLMVVQFGSSVARHGRTPFGFACRLVLASSKSFLLSSVIKALLKSETSLRALATEFLNANRKASAKASC